MLRRVLFVNLILACWPAVVWAHAGQQGFVLLLPTNVYATAGCLAVLVSVLVLVMWPNIRVSGPIPRVQSTPKSVWLGLALLIALITIGLVGPTDPLVNLLPLGVWTGWWIGLLSLQAVWGDLWRYISPVGPVAGLFGDEQTGPSVGLWPACVVFFAFAAFALADPAPDAPTRLSWVLSMVFAGLMLIMALTSGRWVRDHCDPFGPIFSIFADLATRRHGRWQFPGAVLLERPQIPLSLGVLAVLFLASGSFDGINETFWWLALLGVNPLEFPGRSALVVPTLVGLICANLVLLAVLWAVLWIGHAWSGSKLTTRGYALFALTLVPIGWAYHVSHFLPTALVNGQYLWAAMNDPFATGARLFGADTLRVTTGFFNTQATVRLIYLTQAGIVVFGHIIGVVLAHEAAHRCVRSDGSALKLQLPFAILMLGYTAFGLWLLAAPRGA